MGCGQSFFSAPLWLEPVDASFEKVMVKAEDEELRKNRHALLSELHALMNRVAALTRLAS